MVHFFGAKSAAALMIQVYDLEGTEVKQGLRWLSIISSCPEMMATEGSS